MYFSEHFTKTYRERRRVVKSIVVAFVTFLGLALSGTASADTVQYRVEGTFDTGSLIGLSYLEIFTFDDSTRPDVLSSDPWTTEILSYSLNVENHSKHWTLEDWPLEQSFSQWVDANGFLNSRAFLATPGPPGDPPGNPPAFSRFFDDGSPNSRSKTVKWYDWSIWGTIQTDSTDLDPTVTVTPVPEPATMILLGTGLAGVGASVRRRRKGDKGRGT
ncbi:MAG TPA: PEP-CTERM sorting domain-containing protein [Pyrinomonadaceae bacterium]